MWKTKPKRFSNLQRTPLNEFIACDMEIFIFLLFCIFIAVDVENTKIPARNLINMNHFAYLPRNSSMRLQTHTDTWPSNVAERDDMSIFIFNSQMHKTKAEMFSLNR